MKQQFEELLKSNEEVKKKLDAALEENLRMEADSIFRSPGGEILAVVYKDGSIYTHGGVNLDAINRAGQGLSQHEYRAMARNAVATALGHCLLGNHEFNAIGWWMRHPQTDMPLRRHSEDNRRQHQLFLAELGEGSELHAE